MTFDHDNSRWREPSLQDIREKMRSNPEIRKQAVHDYGLKLSNRKQNYLKRDRETHMLAAKQILKELNKDKENGNGK